MMDISAMMQKLGGGVEQSGEAAMEALKGDMTNPAEVSEFNFAMQSYGQMIQLHASINKKIDDMISGIIAKI